MGNLLRTVASLLLLKPTKPLMPRRLDEISGFGRGGVVQVNVMTI